MKSSPTLGGVICAALTPLDETLAPDVPAAVEHCRRLLGLGCDGINLLGTTGEATSLSVGQRIDLMRGIAESGLPLDRFMAGTGASALADAVTLTQAAADLGFAGALVVPPFYFKNLTVAGVVRYYTELIERVADPRLRLYFYNFPQLSGVVIDPETVALVAKAFPATVAGLKDSSGADGYASAIARSFPDLAIFPSSEAILSTARSDGFAGCISASLNVTAPLARDVWAGAQPGAQRELATLRETIARFPLVPALRHIMSSLRSDDRWQRMLPPLQPLTASQSADLDAQLSSLPAFERVAARAAA